MSLENAKKFMELVKAEESLAKRMVALKDGLQEGEFAFKNDKEFVEKKILPLAKEYGLEFSVEDFMVVANLTLSEMSDEDLQQVSGGFSAKSTVMGLLSLAALVAAPSAMDAVSNSMDVDFGISHTASAETPEEKEQKEKLATAKAQLEENLKYLEESDELYKEGQELVKNADGILNPSFIGMGKQFFAAPDIRTCLNKVNEKNIKIYTKRLENISKSANGSSRDGEGDDEPYEKISDLADLFLRTREVRDDKSYDMGLDTMAQLIEQIVKIKTELAQHEKDMGKESLLRDCVDSVVEASIRLLAFPRWVDSEFVKEQLQEADIFSQFIKLEKEMQQLEIKFAALSKERHGRVKREFEDFKKKVEKSYPGISFLGHGNTVASLIAEAKKLFEEDSSNGQTQKEGQKHLSEKSLKKSEEKQKMKEMTEEEKVGHLQEIIKSLKNGLDKLKKDGRLYQKIQTIISAAENAISTRESDKIISARNYCYWYETALYDVAPHLLKVDNVGDVLDITKLFLKCIIASAYDTSVEYVDDAELNSDVEFLLDCLTLPVIENCPEITVTVDRKSGKITFAKDEINENLDVKDLLEDYNKLAKTQQDLKERINNLNDVKEKGNLLTKLNDVQWSEEKEIPISNGRFCNDVDYLSDELAHVKKMVEREENQQTKTIEKAKKTGREKLQTLEKAIVAAENKGGDSLDSAKKLQAELTAALDGADANAIKHAADKAAEAVTKLKKEEEERQLNEAKKNGQQALGKLTHALVEADGKGGDSLNRAEKLQAELTAALDGADANAIMQTANKVDNMVTTLKSAVNNENEAAQEQTNDMIKRNDVKREISYTKAPWGWGILTSWTEVVDHVFKALESANYNLKLFDEKGHALLMDDIKKIVSSATDIEGEPKIPRKRAYSYGTGGTKSSENTKLKILIAINKVGQVPETLINELDVRKSSESR